MAGRWYVSIILAGTMFLAGCRSQSLMPCDLLFHVSEESNQITDVTPGMIDHVAIYMGGDSCIEAIGRGVVVTPLHTLLHREKGRYIVGRVAAHLDRPATLRRARTYLARQYDHLFLPDNDAIYCSELVMLAYVDRSGQPVFTPIPMSFHDESGRITDYWKQFYAQHGMQVPEGAPGTNPGEMSQRRVVRLLKY